jgi:hypothetical protein
MGAGFLSQDRQPLARQGLVTEPRGSLPLAHVAHRLWHPDPFRGYPDRVCPRVSRGPS